MGKWSELPEDLVLLVEDFLTFYEDKIRVRVVCSMWNYFLLKMPIRKHRQFPFILQALENNEDASHALFNPIEKKSYLLDLPELKGMLFKGSSYGWVVTLGDTCDFLSPEISLFNPLTRVRIKLPSRSTFTDVVNYNAENVGCEYRLFNCRSAGEDDIGTFSSDRANFEFTDKFILSSQPEYCGYNDCFVVAIYGLNNIAYCKLNDEKWTPLLENNPLNIDDIRDMIFYQEKLHVLDFYGRLFAFEDKDISPYSNVTYVGGAILPEEDGLVKYLVENSKLGIMMLVRYIKDYKDTGREGVTRTYRFSAYKLDAVHSDRVDWVEVKDIGEEVFFVGLNASFSISSFVYPEFKKNHVYFTDAYHTIGDSDTGVFNIEDGIVESLSGFEDNPKFSWPVPIYIV